MSTKTSTYCPFENCLRIYKWVFSAEAISIESWSWQGFPSWHSFPASLISLLASRHLWKGVLWCRGLSEWGVGTTMCGQQPSAMSRLTNALQRWDNLGIWAKGLQVQSLHGFTLFFIVVKYTEHNLYHLKPFKGIIQHIKYNVTQPLPPSISGNFSLSQSKSLDSLNNYCPFHSPWESLVLWYFYAVFFFSGLLLQNPRP